MIYGQVRREKFHNTSGCSKLKLLKPCCEFSELARRIISELELSTTALMYKTQEELNRENVLLTSDDI